MANDLLKAAAWNLIRMVEEKNDGGTRDALEILRLALIEIDKEIPIEVFFCKHPGCGGTRRTEVTDG